MGLSECRYCWDTPCRCGYDYLSWSVDSLDKHIARLQAVRDWRLQNPGQLDSAKAWESFLIVLSGVRDKPRFFPFPKVEGLHLTIEDLQELSAMSLEDIKQGLASAPDLDEDHE